MKINQQEKVSGNWLAVLMLEVAMLFLGGVLITSTAQAGEAFVGARETLKQYVAELQKNPDNQELREKIIKLALTLDPAPVVPEEARRSMVKANTALKEAKDAKGYDRAISQYNEALLTAPWWAEAYFNLAKTLELRQRYGDAIKNYQWYLLAAPQAEDARAVKDKIYEIEEKKEEKAIGPPSNEPPKTKVDQTKAGVGKNIFNGKGVCFVCHGIDGVIGRGDAAGSKLNPKPSDLRNARALRLLTDQERFNAIKNGIPRTGMPSYNDKLTDDEIWAAIEYLRELRGP